MCLERGQSREGRCLQSSQEQTDSSPQEGRIPWYNHLRGLSAWWGAPHDVDFSWVPHEILTSAWWEAKRLTYTENPSKFLFRTKVLGSHRLWEVLLETLPPLYSLPWRNELQQFLLSFETSYCEIILNSWKRGREEYTSCPLPKHAWQIAVALSSHMCVFILLNI